MSLMEKFRGSCAEDFSPEGLRVLIVDDDAVCLTMLEAMLRQCSYIVTSCTRATEALALLRENKTNFDLVMSDVYMPDMDGFRLLELIGLELDLPVIMMSANGDTKVVMRGITHGACDYLLKPVRCEELRNIWQHVIRKRGKGEGMKEDNSAEWDVLSRSFESRTGAENHIRKREEQIEPLVELPSEAASLKKSRVFWSVELHQRFVNAVNELDIEKAVPKKILEKMAVEGLSRENVASHLQKFRKYMKRLNGVDPQPHPVASYKISHSGKFVGSMEIQPGGRGPCSSSWAKAINVPITPAPLKVSAVAKDPPNFEAGTDLGGVHTVKGFGRRSQGIDAATLPSVAQLQAYQQRHSACMGSIQQSLLPSMPAANSGYSEYASSTSRHQPTLPLVVGYLEHSSSECASMAGGYSGYLPSECTSVAVRQESTAPSGGSGQSGISSAECNNLFSNYKDCMGRVYLSLPASEMQCRSDEL